VRCTARPEPALGIRRIGDEIAFREYVTIHRGSKEGTTTCIGNNNFQMAGIHVVHNVQLGNRTVIANNCLLAGYVDVQDEAMLGVVRFFTSSCGSAPTMVRGGTAWSIPPFARGTRVNGLGGLNVIGIRRGGLGAQARSDVKRAFSLVYRSGLNFTQPLSRPCKACGQRKLRFSLASSRPRAGLAADCAPREKCARIRSTRRPQQSQ
jgi:UDP-N-acetylglucosamine acyltransferase